jgi:hypothetical protein
MESYYAAREMADMHFEPMEILGTHVASAQNIIHNAGSHLTNYSPNFTSDWASLGPVLL